MSRAERGLLRSLAAIGGGALALATATVHPLGILLGGVVWGLLAPTVRRGVLYGVAFGVVVVTAFGGRLVAAGTGSAFLGTGALAAAPVAIALVLGGVGGFARGLR